MILIADSGSTKTTWSIVRQGVVIRSINTPGINPYFQSEVEMGRLIAGLLLPRLHIHSKEIKSIRFYGAGCTSEKTGIVKNALAAHLQAGSIEVNSDLLGAARGICGQEAGIACILGTGSNSCFYDGNKIIKNIAPLGFILGDEGSGAALGKLFIGDLLKERLPVALKEKFFNQFGLTPAKIIDKVYRQPFPNRFLAGFSPFLAENIQEPAIYQLVLYSFKSFFDRNVKKYDYRNYAASFTGSVACHYKDILMEAAKQCNIRIARIEQSPMNGLIKYHTDPLK
ncbi:MAG: ATPase [Tannerella sp.]|jgi:N-acetylglucosamine kinase-like BadF-type ATPase|nr:ATPase [Tannerella sp.]